MVPICLIALVGLVASSWGSQFYIICIEAILITVCMIIITIIEFNTGTLYGYNKITDNESFVDVHSIPDSVEDQEEIDKKLRRDALKGIINKIGGHGDVFDTNKVER